jgi:hypothetical protein
MAQVNVQYPALNQLFGAQSVMPAYYGTQQMMAAEENEKINQQQALQDMLFKSQDQPLDLQQKQANIDQSAAMLPGYQADAFLKKRTADVRAGTSIQQEIETAAKHLYNDFKAEDIKMFDTETDMMLRSRDPREVEQGKQRSMLSRAIVQEQAKAAALADREKEKLRMMGENSLAVARENNAGRMAAAGARMQAPKGLADKIKGMSPDKAAELYNALAIEAADSGNIERANFYQQEAQRAALTHQANLKLRAEAAKEGKFDLGAAGVEVVPRAPLPGMVSGTPMGQNNPIAASPNNSASPEAKAAATYKQAFGSYDPDKYDYRISPDGKPQRKPK